MTEPLTPEQAREWAEQFGPRGRAMVMGLKSECPVAKWEVVLKATLRAYADQAERLKEMEAAVEQFLISGPRLAKQVGLLAQQMICATTSPMPAPVSALLWRRTMTPDLHNLVRAFFRQMKAADAELTMNQPDEGMALAHTMNEMKRAVGLLEPEANQ